MKKLLFLLLVPTLFLPCLSASAQSGYKIPLREPIMGTDVLEGDTGMELMTNYISMIYKYGASILGIICVLVIVISGIQISMGGANDQWQSDAKARIWQALLSLAILFLSAAILRTINPGFFDYTPKESSGVVAPDTKSQSEYDKIARDATAAKTLKVQRAAQAKAAATSPFDTPPTDPDGTPQQYIDGGWKSVKPSF